MNVRELAARLAETDKNGQSDLLHRLPGNRLPELAAELRQLCYDAWVSDPERTRRIISAIVLTASASADSDLAPLSHWAFGIGAVLDGKMTEAVEFFDRARDGFIRRGLPKDAAETSVGAIYALAMLGRYEDAIGAASYARDVFILHDDLLATAKIEHNLGNLYQRRDLYREAETELRSARARYLAAGETLRRIQTDNSLANAIAHQHRFEEAIAIYQCALDEAEGQGLARTCAEIESNVGQLLLFQGRFDRALILFEQSRLRYQALSMPHQTAIADQEIADVYLELNLFPEASATYRRVESIFSELGLRAERARVLSGLARSELAQGRLDAAISAIDDARDIFGSEGNAVGIANLDLCEARLLLLDSKFREASGRAAEARSVFENAGFLGRAVLAQWLSGEAQRCLGNRTDADRLLKGALQRSIELSIPQIQLNCLTSLGHLAGPENPTTAANYFRRSIAIVEALREPLPGEDFRTAFFSDKTEPYHGLVEILANSDGGLDEALELSERARSRVLSEMIGAPRQTPVSAAEASHREELSWLYRRQDDLLQSGKPDRTAADRLRERIVSVEQAILESRRKYEIGANPALPDGGAFNLAELRSNLGHDGALIEYTIIGDEYAAFVATDRETQLVRGLGNTTVVRTELQSVGSAMTSVYRSRAECGAAIAARAPLERLYDILFRPIEEQIGSRRLIIVPFGDLHTAPFAALHDGFEYLIESAEVSYAPSAAVFNQCVRRRGGVPERPVIVGVSDEFAPGIESEVNQLREIFPDAAVLVGESATSQSLISEANGADLLHFACHGRFRRDNPLFSALRLADGWFSVRDADRLGLDSALVVLSACETGISKILGGNEILGLTRGFLLSGATTVVTSLWPVDDSATVGLMSRFYRELRQGKRPAEALRLAQIQVLETNPHPFFWSPWIPIGAA